MGSRQGLAAAITARSHPSAYGASYKCMISMDGPARASGDKHDGAVHDGEQIVEVHLLPHGALAAEAERREGPAIRVELYPVGDAVLHQRGDPAANDQLRAQAQYLPVEIRRERLEDLHAGERYPEHGRYALPVGGQLVGHQHVSYGRHAGHVMPAPPPAAWCKRVRFCWPLWARHSERYPRSAARSRIPRRS